MKYGCYPSHCVRIAAGCLKGSAIIAGLGAIVPEEVPFMGIGEYPGIEALAFAVCELKDDSRWRPAKEQRYDRPPVFHRLGF